MRAGPTGASLFALALLALGACGGEATPAVGPEANEYFPMVRDARWVLVNTLALSPEFRQAFRLLGVRVQSLGDRL